jgi:carbon monoxide dehydrogenase subunit G
MELQNSLTVPLPMDEAWKTLLDIERIAPCMPGAQLTEVKDDRTFLGKVSLRLGPVSLAFNGTATFEDINETDHSVRVRAQGVDSKGRGGANALVSFQLKPVAEGTEVLVNTDLKLSGSVAQYGRASGIIQQVAADLISQFAKALKAEIARSRPEAAPAAASNDAPPQASASRPAAAPAQPVAAKPISGFSLMARVLWRSIVGLFRRGPTAG